jgi:monoamine oxidase
MMQKLSIGLRLLIGKDYNQMQNTGLTYHSASGWFNEAFAENVLESLAFGYADTSKDEKPIDWYCIEGGTGKLIESLVNHIQKDKIKLKHWVTRIALSDDNKKTANFPMEVAFDIKDKKDSEAGKQIGVYKSTKQHYSAVINTTTLGALQKMDLTGMALPYGMKTAIRVLHYDTSTKVGIKFKKMWWKDPAFMENPIDCGGVAKTDMSLRVW